MIEGNEIQTTEKVLKKKMNTLVQKMDCKYGRTEWKENND